MRISGSALIIPQHNVDTDVLYPGPYLNLDDPERMKEHLFDGLDPTLRERLVGDTILLVGDNFGVGSSREHVPLAMRASGIRAVVGGSFARIFFRNCINLGLPAVACPSAVAAARPGVEVVVELEQGRVILDGRTFDAVPLPGFVVDMLASGGLTPWVRRRLRLDPSSGGSASTG